MSVLQIALAGYGLFLCVVVFVGRAIAVRRALRVKRRYDK